jgi:hypothetical protein
MAGGCARATARGIERARALDAEAQREHRRDRHRRLVAETGERFDRRDQSEHDEQHEHDQRDEIDAQLLARKQCDRGDDEDEREPGVEAHARRSTHITHTRRGAPILRSDGGEADKRRNVRREGHRAAW